MAAFALTQCDAAVLITGDTDLSAEIRIALTTFPSGKIGLVFQYGRFNRELAYLADLQRKASPGLYAMCQLPDQVQAADGTFITKPLSW